MTEDKLATFKIDPEVWNRFKSKAAANKTNASALLKDFIRAYLDGRISPDGVADDVTAKIQAIEAKYAELDERLGKLNAA